MGTIELKSNLHNLINNIESVELLESVYDFLIQNKNAQSGNLWSSLTEEQRKEVIEAYGESEKEENLIPHSEVLKSIT
ncbi:MAG: hypothetical protein O2887_00060 [Bacteroidetes bacterium]|nr:hypothetical protein [Bacteroidota bacterium]MDA1118884.1 hypothetical protein [Bacteroidota bacterium]